MADQTNDGLAQRVGRPTDYCVETADAICERIADGESLRKICLDEDMPNKATVFRWLAAHEEFRDQYARARDVQADSLFDDVLNIADTPQLGERRKIKEDGSIEVMQFDMIEHRRLQVDARKWMAGKLRPKVYGDKLDIEHTGQVVMIAPEASDL